MTTDQRNCLTSDQQFTAIRRRGEGGRKGRGDTGPPTGVTQAADRGPSERGGAGRGMQRPTLQEGSVPLEEGAAWPEGRTCCAETEEEAA